DYRLRQDERVVVMERTNARYLESLPEPVDIVTIDVSFISLDLILGVASALARQGGQVIALIKPQFEAGKGAVDRKGVVRDERTRRDVVERVVKAAAGHNLAMRGLERSPLVGPAGNEEFLGYFVKEGEALPANEMIDSVFSR